MSNLVPSRFRPAWWLPGPHLQTLWPTFFRKRPALDLTPERVELADGDFIDLAWHRRGGRPLVVVIHGLEGSLHSHYAKTTLAALDASGFDSVFMFLRGSSGEPNRLPRRYHSGATEDLAAILDHLQAAHGLEPQGAVGFSLGGNLLLKFLGEGKYPVPFRAAVAVSVPYRLMDCAVRLESGFSRRYREHLIHRLRRSYHAKFSRMPSPLDVDVDRLAGFYEFDDRVTAPLHGFAGADDYYRRCSSRQFLGAITIPTLLLHALDDPFMTPDTVPGKEELAESVTLELSQHGGHVGFVSGSAPWKPLYWLDKRIPEFFLAELS